MGYASYLVWKEGGGFNDATKLPFILYAVQLGLNWAWTPLFLGKKHLKASSVWMVTLTGVAATTGFAFYRFSSLAGLLYVPYLTWLSLASALNIIIYRDNPQAIDDKKE
jgi:translocator protein